MMILITLVAVVGALWIVGRLVLQGPDLSPFDEPRHEQTGKRTQPSEQHAAVVQMLVQGAAQFAGLKRAERLALMRQQMDQGGDQVAFDGEIQPVDVNGVPGEWVTVPDADSARRLLYLHGGGFVAGSPRSHRAITTELAKRLGMAVLAIDYRLMPENPRMACVEDCRAAYRWVLEHGPHGATPLHSLVVAGDSAGGNLALGIAAWARDEQLPAADAVVALSPATDATLGSPSLRRNQPTDVMLGQAMGFMVRAPRVLMLWFTLLSNRLNPSNPVLSPALGDLSNLPPTLVHVSSAEMLLDDAVRYVNKASVAGCQAKLGIWPFMLHVWHVFVGDPPSGLPEAAEAFDHIEAFVNQHINAGP